MAKCDCVGGCCCNCRGCRNSGHGKGCQYMAEEGSSRCSACDPPTGYLLPGMTGSAGMTRWPRTGQREQEWRPDQWL